MNKYKFLILALALSGFMLIVAGCKKNESAASATAADAAEAAKNLLFWTHQNLAWEESNARIVKAFMEENPDINIQIEAFPYDAFEQKTQTALASKTGGADIFELWGGWILDFAPTGALAAVPDSFINTIKNDTYDPVLKGVQHDGKYYGIPIEFNQEGAGLLVNKPWFEENGIAYPATWSEMIDIARKHRTVDNGEITMRGFDFISQDTLLFTYTSMIVSKGGSYLENDGHRFNFDTPAAKEALQDLVNYVKVDNLTNIDVFQGSTFNNEYGVFMGTTLMAPRGFWTIPSGAIDYGVEYGIDFDFVGLPFYGPEKKWVAETGWAQVVNASSKYPEESWKFVEYCHQTANLVQMAIDRGMIPPMKSAATSPAYLAAVPYAKPVVDVLDGAVHVGYINTDIFKLALINVFVDMVQNNLSVEDAAKRLTEECNAAAK